MQYRTIIGVVASILFARCVQGQTDNAISPLADSAFTFGLGFQFSNSDLFVASWQSPEHDRRTWRIEPMVGLTYSDKESPANNSYSATTVAITLGLGCYLRWRMPRPFDNLFFSVGPRASITGFKSTTEEVYPQGSSLRNTQQYLISSLSILAGPEYAIDRGEHFTVSGFVSLNASIQGYTKYDPPGENSTWNFSLTTGTGIVLRFYFM